MQTLTFNELPLAVSQLFEKLEIIENLLLAQSSTSTPAPDEFLTVTQVAEMLNLSVPTMYGLTQRAEIPFCKTGKRLYFSKAEVTAWIKAGRNKTVLETAKDALDYLQNKKGGKV